MSPVSEEEPPPDDFLPEDKDIAIILTPGMMPGWQWQVTQWSVDQFAAREGYDQRIPLLDTVQVVSQDATLSFSEIGAPYVGHDSYATAGKFVSDDNEGDWSEYINWKDDN
jgi:hypothetical protein